MSGAFAFNYGELVDVVFQCGRLPPGGEPMYISYDEHKTALTKSGTAKLVPYLASEARLGERSNWPRDWQDWLSALQRVRGFGRAKGRQVVIEVLRQNSVLQRINETYQTAPFLVRTELAARDTANGQVAKHVRELAWDLWTKHNGDAEAIAVAAAELAEKHPTSATMLLAKNCGRKETISLTKRAANARLRKIRNVLKTPGLTPSRALAQIVGIVRP